MNRTLKSYLSGFGEPDLFIRTLNDPVAISQIEKVPGVYIFIRDHKKFVYPNGESRTIYIGQSKNLRRRLRKHHKNIKELNKIKKTERHLQWYWSRYQYAISYGCQIFIFFCNEYEEPRNLEYDLLSSFYCRYLSIPVGNGTVSYSSN